MIAKIFALLCLFGLARAGHLYGGYAGYAAVAPSYAYSPYAYAHAPAVSHVSQYSVHSAPVVKSYAYTTPVVKSYVASPYVGHSYAAPLAYGYGGYGNYGHGYGYANKYASW